MSVNAEHERLVANLAQLPLGIAACRENRLITPALILLYCGIDIVASLWTRQESTPPSRRFVQWTSQYLLPGSPLKCNAVDLYGARCGLVHTLTADSDLSVLGKARKVVYTWGTANVDVVHAMTRTARMENTWVAVHFEDLLGAFVNGVERWLVDLKRNPKRARKAYDRAARFFNTWSPEAMQAFIADVEARGG